VTNTLDDGNAGSLRWAINQVNADTDSSSTIDFNIPGSGVHTISPTTDLPAINHPVTIDGFSQPGSSANNQAIGDNAVRLIAIDGSADTSTSPNGLVLTGGDSSVSGLAIANFAGHGIWLRTNGGDKITGNAISSNGSACIWVGEDSGPAVNGDNDTIGGAGLPDRNLLSTFNSYLVIRGNNNVVQGNYFGVDATGLNRAAHSAIYGVVVADGEGNLIGGTSHGTGNVIGARGADLVLGSLVFGNGDASNNKVQGNFLGTGATGRAPLPAVSPLNDLIGVEIDGGGYELIGGSDPGAGNVISGHSNVAIGDYGGVGHSCIQGNFIGTDISGANPIPNDIGIDAAQPDDTIGGAGSAESNMIAFNTSGGVLGRGDDCLIEGNSIHDNGGSGASVVNANGVRIEGNSIHSNQEAGVEVSDWPITSATIGDNTITDNGGPGVWLHGNQLDLTYNSFNQVYGGGPFIPTGIRIQQNSISGNAGLGIDLGAIPVDANNVQTNDVNQWVNDIPDGVPQNGSPVGINRGQTFPVLSYAWLGPNLGVSGTFDSTLTNTTFTLDFYSNMQADPSGYGQGQTYLGEATVCTDGSGHADLNLSLPFTVPVGQWLSVTATDPNGDTSEFSKDVQVQTYAQYLQAILPQSSSSSNALTITAGQSSTPAVVIDAINQLTNVSQPVTITLDLAGQTWTTDIAANPPDNVTLKIQNGTLIGGSPAITVSGGIVLVQNCTLTNATNAPTVLVTGGHLTLRNDVIQESTGYAQVGVLVTGGTADLGTAAAPGLNTINVNGPGTPAVSDTPTAFPSAGNVWEVNGVAVSGPSAVKAAPTVHVTGGSFAYDENAHPATGSVTGTAGEALGGPTFSYSYIDDDENTVTTSSPPTDPGYYTVTASFAGNDNYLPALATATITIYFDVRTLTDLSKAFNAGRTIPIKIQLTDAAGNNISSPDISVRAVGLYRVNADGSRTQVTLQDGGGSNPNDVFRYDAGLNGYIFNLSTKGLGAGTYAFDWMAGDDPTRHELGFKLI
jgi:parallel beta-helix repeat protein